MNKKAVILGGAALLGAAYYLRQSSAAAVLPASDGDSLPEYLPPEPDLSAGSVMTSIDDWINQNIVESEYNMLQPAPLPQSGANRRAMLATIRASEGTADRSDPYRVCYAYKHTIASFADHPALTGEWRGETLSASMCAGAGLGPGCVSTAAGAYQIIKPTWWNLKTKLGLPDFSPASQDAAAIELLRQRGALGPLDRGDFAGAIQAARKEWASLPGAGYGQGERSLSWLVAQFTGAGGVLA